MFFLFAGFPLTGFSQTTADVAVDSLVKMGFENVRWTEDADERVYLLENSAYRRIGRGISRAVDVVTAAGLPEGKACRIVVLDNNIPQLSLVHRPTIQHTPIEGDTLVTEGYEAWDVSYQLGNTWREALRRPVRNSSLYKVEVVVYPELGLRNKVRTQLYQVLFNLSPAVEVSLWKGMKVQAQVIFPIYHDGYSTLQKKVRPGFLGVSQSARLPYNIWGTLTAGLFSNSRYGVDLQMKHQLLFDNRFGIEGRIGYTGMGYWNGFRYHYGVERMFTWSVGASFYWPGRNLETSLKVEKYLLGEHAVRFDIMRHFRYTTVGFYAMKPDRSDIKINGGFRFQVLLPPYKYKRKGYIPRVTVSPNMGMSYNASNDEYHYRSYRAAGNRNIMQNNRFNPYYIESELENN